MPRRNSTRHARAWWPRACCASGWRCCGRRWPGMAVLGIGYAAPYLRAVAGGGGALHRADARADRAPRAGRAGAPNLSCTAEEDALPFPDLCFDRILLVHGLEAAENARRMLREVWRVLKRRRAAAGGGAQPARHVGACREHAVRPGPALFAGPDRPPAARQPVPRWSGATPRCMCRRPACAWCCAARTLLERLGRRLVPRLAGVTLTEAVKDVFAALPLTVMPAKALSRRVMVARSR